MARWLRRFGAVLVGCAALSVASCGQPVQVAPTSSPTQARSPAWTPTESPSALPSTPEGPVRYLPLGDSITDGFSYPGGYRVALWQRLVGRDGDEIDFVGSQRSGPESLADTDNEGHPGWCIAGTCGGSGSTSVTPEVRRWVRTYRPDIISIHLGTNDLKLAASGATVAYRLDVLVGQILQENPDAQVLLVQIIHMELNEQARDEYVRLIPNIAARYRAKGYRVVTVDLSRTLTYPTDYVDPLHPNKAGYAKMAAALYPALAAAYRQAR